MHEQHRNLPRRRQDGVGDVVHREVVVDLEARHHGPAAAVAERQDDRAAHARLERHLLLGDRLAVELERERERLRLGRVVHERDERLVVEGAEVVLPDGEVRDPDVLAPPPHADPPDARVARLGARRQREGAVGEDVDLGAGVGRDERAGRAHGLDERLRGADRGQRPLAVARERRGDSRLDTRLDHHDLGALAEAPDEAERLAARDVEAGGRDVGRLHRSGGVEHDDDLARSVPHERHGRARQRHGEGEERQELEDQQRVALEPLEERGRLPVAERRIPQEQARHTLLAAADLEEVEEDERQRQREQRERERREETHTRRRPLTCESTKSCTGVSVVTRW